MRGLRAGRRHGDPGRGPRRGASTRGRPPDDSGGRGAHHERSRPRSAATPAPHDADPYRGDAAVTGTATAPGPTRARGTRAERERAAVAASLAPVIDAITDAAQARAQAIAGRRRRRRRRRVGPCAPRGGADPRRGPRRRHRGRGRRTAASQLAVARRQAREMRPRRPADRPTRRSGRGACGAGSPASTPDGRRLAERLADPGARPGRRVGVGASDRTGRPRGDGRVRQPPGRARSRRSWSTGPRVARPRDRGAVGVTDPTTAIARADVPGSGRVVRVNGPLVEVEGLARVAVADVIEVGRRRAGRRGGLGRARPGHRPGLRVHRRPAGRRPAPSALGRPLSARLGPGLLGGVFDGLLRPLAGRAAWLAPGALARRTAPATVAVRPGRVARVARSRPGRVLGTVADGLGRRPPGARCPPGVARRRSSGSPSDGEVGEDDAGRRRRRPTGGGERAVAGARAAAGAGPARAVGAAAHRPAGGRPALPDRQGCDRGRPGRLRHRQDGAAPADRQVVRGRRGRLRRLRRARQRAGRRAGRARRARGPADRPRACSSGRW